MSSDCMISFVAHLLILDQSVLIHFGQMVAFVDLKECDKIDFREQQEWWWEMLPDCITGVRVWEYDNTMTDPDPRKLNTSMFQFDVML